MSGLSWPILDAVKGGTPKLTQVLKPLGLCGFDGTLRQAQGRLKSRALQSRFMRWLLDPFADAADDGDLGALAEADGEAGGQRVEHD